MTDVLCLAGMAVALGFGVWGAVINRGIALKAGSIVAALACCDGFAYFGWRPYFGGTQHDMGTYFGCIILTFGTVAWLVCQGISATRLRPSDKKPAK